MWIFSVKGFVSIVADKLDPEALHIRGRFKGDIENVFPGAPVAETPYHDYRYRTTLPRVDVGVRLADLIGSIDYPNFKDAVPDKGRHDTYLKVWTSMHAAQLAEHPMTHSWVRPEPEDLPWWHYNASFGDPEPWPAPPRPQVKLSKRQRKKLRKQRDADAWMGLPLIAPKARTK